MPLTYRKLLTAVSLFVKFNSILLQGTLHYIVCAIVKQYIFSIKNKT